MASAKRKIFEEETESRKILTPATMASAKRKIYEEETESRKKKKSRESILTPATMASAKRKIYEEETESRKKQKSRESILTPATMASAKRKIYEEETESRKKKKSRESILTPATMASAKRKIYEEETESRKKKKSRESILTPATMASLKRKIFEEETESRKKKKAATERMEVRLSDLPDRLSDLPEALQLQILACLDTKQAIQTTKLSRSWVSMWTWIPILEFNSFSFHNVDNLHKFVKEVLSGRDPLAKLDHLKLNFENDGPEILKSVFEYAFSHGVKHLEVSIKSLHGIDFWPVCLLCDSLMSLKLKVGSTPLRCPFLGPRSVLFRNLTVLYLEGALLTDVEPFSGFPVLESLTLICCHLSTEGIPCYPLKVHTLRLSDLTISNCIGMVYWELKTPRLNFFQYCGPQLLLHEGLPVLETMEINFNVFTCYRSKEEEKHEFLLLLAMFLNLPPNIKSLRVFWATVLLLSLFPDELAMGSSPFLELKDLTMDLSFPCLRLFHRRYETVKAYLLHNSPHTRFTIIYPKT